VIETPGDNIPKPKKGALNQTVQHSSESDGFSFPKIDTDSEIRFNASSPSFTTGHQSKEITMKAFLAVFVSSLFCIHAHANPGNFTGRNFTLRDHVEKSTTIEKRFRHPRNSMTVRLSTVFWNDSENENWSAYHEFTFFEVQLRKRGFIKDYRPACEWDRVNRSSPTHCSVEGQVYDEAGRKTVIVVECNGRPSRQFDTAWEGSPGDAVRFFDEEHRDIMRR
jgi:hypothetical protein